MAQPLLGRLHEKIPGLQLDVLAPEWVAAVVRRMPEVDDVIAVAFRHGALQLRSRWKIGRELKARGYQQAIVLPNTWKSALVPFFADIPLRSGYVGESRYGLLNLRSEEHTSELQSLAYLVCRLLLEKKKNVAAQAENCQQQSHRFDERPIETQMLPE